MNPESFADPRRTDPLGGQSLERAFVAHRLHPIRKQQRVEEKLLTSLRRSFGRLHARRGSTAEGDRLEPAPFRSLKRGPGSQGAAERQDESG